MKYDCRYRLPEKCMHTVVKDTISFALDEKEMCGDCSYREPPTENSRNGEHILQQTNGGAKPK